jgi:hypothetical protein
MVRNSSAPSGITAAVELHKDRRDDRPMVASSNTHWMLHVRDEVSSLVVCVSKVIQGRTSKHPRMANWDVQSVDRLVQQLCTSHDAVELIA